MTETTLARKLKRLIEANGPMSVADYMAHCLGDPEHGYYTTRDPFGAHGDFITAPEVSQMFGEIVGAWLIETWRSIGSPSPFRLVELGPGRGTLIADVLRVAARAQDFLKAASIHLVETSRVLKGQQAKALAFADCEIQWHSSFSEIPAGPVVLVANEFFDALPVRQYVADGDEWRERVVGLDKEGVLVFGVGAGTLGTPPPPTSSVPLPRYAGEEQRSILEIRPRADALIAEIARRIVDQGGVGLIIDYGYEGPAFGDTLQAVRAHEHEHPLASPGDADLTAHVDFSALSESARAEEAAVHGPIEQGRFLVELGLLERAGRLGAKADQETRERLRLAVERLAAPDQMGALFKAMAVARTGVPLPPFGAAGRDAKC